MNNLIILNCHGCLMSLILTETFALVSSPVDKDFGGDDVTKRNEHLHELSITKLLRQVVDKQVAAFRS